MDETDLGIVTADQAGWQCFCFLNAAAASAAIVPWQL